MREREFNEVLRLSRVYRREALRCRKSNAHLASCVMLGAALEALLMAMTSLYWREARQSVHAPRHRGRVRPLAEWDLGRLVQVSRELSWLPAELAPGADWEPRRARIGDYAEALHQTRNLVHAGYYLRAHSPARVTRRYSQSYWEILSACVDWLNQRVTADLRKLLH